MNLHLSTRNKKKHMQSGTRFLKKVVFEAKKMKMHWILVKNVIHF